MLSVLDSRSSGPGLSPGRGHWARHFTPTVPLSTQVHKWVMDCHPIQGAVEILLVAPYYRNRDKLWTNGPLGS